MNTANNISKKWVIIICIMLIIGTGVFLYLYDKKKNQQDNPGIGNGSTKPESTSVFPLKEGSKGDYVKQLQQKLNTLVALKKQYTFVQPPTYNGAEIKSLFVDGIFGPRTLIYLQYAFSNKSKTEISESEFNNL